MLEGSTVIMIGAHNTGGIKEVPDPYGVAGTSWTGTEVNTIRVEFYEAQRWTFRNSSISVDGPSQFRYLMKHVFGR